VLRRLLPQPGGFDLAYGCCANFWVTFGSLIAVI